MNLSWTFGGPKDPARQGQADGFSRQSLTSEHLLGVFVALARRPLRECEVVAISFDTRTYAFTPVQGSRPKGGGGTCFQAIEEYALSRPRYPDVVVVFTDGQAPRPHLRHPDRWIWCLTCSLPPMAVRGLGECVMLPA